MEIKILCAKDNQPKPSFQNILIIVPNCQLVKQFIDDLTDYGLRGGGYCQCPRCHSNNAAFVALADDRFFRPTVGNLSS